MQKNAVVMYPQSDSFKLTEQCPTTTAREKTETSPYKRCLDDSKIAVRFDRF